MIMNADLARERQRTMLDDAATRQMARGTTTAAPRYREWLARQFAVLALRIAPSLRGSFLTVSEQPGPTDPLEPSANGSSLGLVK